MRQGDGSAGIYFPWLLNQQPSTTYGEVHSAFEW